MDEDLDTVIRELGNAYRALGRALDLLGTDTAPAHPRVRNAAIDAVTLTSRAFGLACLTRETSK